MHKLDRRSFLGLAGALSVSQAAHAGLALSLLPQQDADDGLTFRVLAIHDIRDDLRADVATVADTCAISTAMLNNIFAWIRANDFRPVSVEQIIAARNGGAPLPPRAVLLSFDDAYASQYTKAFPLLKQYGYPALIAVVSRWTDTPRGQPVRIGYKSLMAPGYFMRWEHLREMADSGLVEIASHTHDMHHGAVANPQGNELPAASAHLYFPELGRYENDDEYQRRTTADLQRCSDLIQANTGVAPRAMVWPYGTYNSALIGASRQLGMRVHFTLDEGPNTPDVPLTRIRRQLVSYDWDAGVMLAQFRRQSAYRGDSHPIERVVDVALDDVYDADPARQEARLSHLLDRIKALEPKSVFLKAYHDPDGSGSARALYFPNRHLPMRADLFSRTAWQLITRTGVQVYAALPLLAFRLPAGHAAAARLVTAAPGADGTPAAARGMPRLSPFDARARATIRDIYYDLARYTSFNGIVFGADACLGESEDAGDAALAAYADWGLPPSVAAIRADPELRRRWSEGKLRHLGDLTRDLAALVTDYQGGSVLTVRTLRADAVLEPDGVARLAQDLDAFAAAYDFVKLPASEDSGAPPSTAWLDGLARAVAAHPLALRKTIFSLQALDGRTGTPIASSALRAQMQRLRAAGARHLGYSPDQFMADQPDLAVLRDVMSMQNLVRPRTGMKV
ncbi:poly-beta-1,6-N-acetyl-D-glucosamine N-deacetylase PgaB [Cupriavidus malaysiensis]|uniref:Poly-beta-1,6-N-acetyl-D-glucosamine N-deacetylase PgaB n=1 Tax=Cupriavidus malaysiensis TaxID=367825 RepID=A0ABM6FB64_9BURK|nr:poly-beta-1,6-N-acetyl-D-glucosamine N-deacetylase PgaB [Cupriavidus malaysiensis]AOZ08960.1 poly-beta-1,6-N-acetyl-D-glucosamine N-deacetylase PgaB [Cupriavidus malaysiensis]